MASAGVFVFSETISGFIISLGEPENDRLKILARITCVCRIRSYTIGLR